MGVCLGRGARPLGGLSYAFTGGTRTPQPAPPRILDAMNAARAAMGKSMVHRQAAAPGLR
jgi:hypothetical protein